MTTPIQIGLPQILLFILFVLGIALLISSLMGLFQGRRELEIFEDEAGHQYRRWRRRRRQLRWRRGTSGILLLVLSCFLLWITFSIQGYLGLTSDIKVATVQSTTISNGDPQHPQISVTLTIINSNGTAQQPKAYLLNGDQWILYSDMLKFPSWMNIFGIHSGYKLTQLEGIYSNPTMESHGQHTVIVLNGGNDNFFKTVYKQAWSSPFVDAAYGNAVFEPADGQTYNIYVSQTGLYAKPANK
jgi:hypothetical protein